MFFIKLLGEVYQEVLHGGREFLINIYNELCNVLGKDIEPIFEQDRKGDIKHNNADISKARNMLHYEAKWDFHKEFEKQ